MQKPPVSSTFHLENHVVEFSSQFDILAGNRALTDDAASATAVEIRSNNVQVGLLKSRYPASEKLGSLEDEVADLHLDGGHHRCVAAGGVVKAVYPF